MLAWVSSIGSFSAAGRSLTGVPGELARAFGPSSTTPAHVCRFPIELPLNFTFANKGVRKVAVKVKRRAQKKDHL